MSCASQKAPKNRRRRKLPSVHRKDCNFPQDSSTVFWFNYQSALHWIRRHENVISQCVQLLQIYPHLIQDTSLNSLWDFIEPLIRTKYPEAKVPRSADSVKREASPVSKRQGKVAVNKSPEIPQISITETHDTPIPSINILAKHARTPRIHLISNCLNNRDTENDTLLHMGVIDMLQEDFYIRVTNTKHTQIDKDGQYSKNRRRHHIISESDLCVYLFNDTTLEDPRCFHDLCIALAQTIPIVYVRYYKNELPKTFSETIYRNSNGCLRLKDYAEMFLRDDTPTPSDSSSSQGNRIRSKNKLTPLTIKSRSSSANELSTRGLEQQGNRHFAPLSPERDLVLTLVNNFKNACVFDEKDAETCSAKLKHTIYQMLGIKEPYLESHAQEQCLSSHDHVVSGKVNLVINSKLTNETRNLPVSNKGCQNKPRFLSVPDPEDLISIREWGTSGSMSAPPHSKLPIDNDPDRSSGGGSFFFGSDVSMTSPTPPLEQKNTTYLVFDRNKSPDGPRRVAFPVHTSNSLTVESDADSDDNQLAPPPIDFCEIDLSREINELGSPESETSSLSSF